MFLCAVFDRISPTHTGEIGGFVRWVVCVCVRRTLWNEVNCCVSSCVFRNLHRLLPGMRSQNGPHTHITHTYNHTASTYASLTHRSASLKCNRATSARCGNVNHFPIVASRRVAGDRDGHSRAACARCRACRHTSPVTKCGSTQCAVGACQSRCALCLSCAPPMDGQFIISIQPAD